MDAYAAGRIAFDEGLDLTDNPYTPLSPDWHDWQQGWSDAQEEGI
ncbi:hypothetical protein [Paraburkholderia sp. SIMBA_054]